MEEKIDQLKKRTRIYLPEEVWPILDAQNHDLRVMMEREFERVPTMDYEEALSVLSWHYCLAAEKPGRCSGEEFSSAYKTVMGPLLRKAYQERKEKNDRRNNNATPVETDP